MLNKSWNPIGVIDVERAFGLFVTGAAKALDKQYQTFDFESWAALGAELGDDVIHTSKYALKVPRVMILQMFDKMPRTQVRFSRQNIYLRDDFTCQYCGKTFPRKNLNLDHVMPKSQGGRTTWENIVCSCIPCNMRKAGRTPAEAGMKLLSKPVKPKWNTVAPTKMKKAPYAEWLPFLDVVTASYWNAELLDDDD